MLLSNSPSLYCAPCERKIEKSALLFVGCRSGVRRESNSIIIIISLQVSWYSFSGNFRLISWNEILFYYFGSFFSAGRSMLFHQRDDAERRDRHLSMRFYIFCNALCKVYDAIVVMNAVPWTRPLLLSIDYVYIGESRRGNARQSTAVQTAGNKVSVFQDWLMMVECACVCVLLLV